MNYWEGSCGRVWGLLRRYYVMFYYYSKESNCYIMRGLGYGEYRVNSLYVMDFVNFLGYRVYGNGGEPLKSFIDSGDLNFGYLSVAGDKMGFKFFLGYSLSAVVGRIFVGKTLYVEPYMGFTLDGEMHLPYKERFERAVRGCLTAGVKFHWWDAAVAERFIRFVEGYVRVLGDGTAGITVGEVLSVFPDAEVVLARWKF